MRKVVYGNPYHGLSPILYVTSIGLELGDVVLPIPSEKIDSVRNVLLQSYSESDEIYLVPSLGNAMLPLSFKGDFPDLVHRVVNGIDRVTNEVEYIMKEGFEGISLDGRKHYFRTPDMELVTGSLVKTPINKQYKFFVFPFLMSQMNSPDAFPQSVQEKIDPNELREFYRLSVSTEEQCRVLFIPLFNTFSYKTGMIQQPQNIVYTPPLAQPLENNDNIPPAIYVGISGTGFGVDLIRDFAKKIKAETGVTVYTVPTGPEDFIRGPLSLLYNPNMKAFVGLPYWGYGSNCQIASLPMITPDYEEPGDHEWIHDNLALAHFGYRVGFIREDIEKDGTGRRAYEEALSKTNVFGELHKRLYEEFGNQWKNGGYSHIRGRIREMI